MYMTPSRRAIAASLPYLSVASSHERKAVAFAFWTLLRALTIQSRARPSLCSLIPPWLHARGMPTV